MPTSVRRKPPQVVSVETASSRCMPGVGAPGRRSVSAIFKTGSASPISASFPPRTVMLGRVACPAREWRNPAEFPSATIHQGSSLGELSGQEVSDASKEGEGEEVHGEEVDGEEVDEQHSYQGIWLRDTGQAFIRTHIASSARRPNRHRLRPCWLPREGRRNPQGRTRG